MSKKSQRKQEAIKGLEELGEKAVIGIRPEFLPIVEKGKLSGLAYSTLPTGMETTVKINFGGDILSAVVFGSIDYEVDEEIQFDIVGDSIILFDAVSKENLALGSVEVIEVGPKPEGEAEKIELIAEGSNPNADVDESKKGFFKKLFGKKKKKEEKKEEAPAKEEEKPAEEEKAE